MAKIVLSYIKTKVGDKITPLNLDDFKATCQAILNLTASAPTNGDSIKSAKIVVKATDRNMTKYPKPKSGKDTGQAQYIQALKDTTFMVADSAKAIEINALELRNLAQTRLETTIKVDWLGNRGGATESTQAEIESAI